MKKRFFELKNILKKISEDKGLVHFKDSPDERYKYLLNILGPSIPEDVDIVLKKISKDEVLNTSDISELVNFIERTPEAVNLLKRHVPYMMGLTARGVVFFSILHVIESILDTGYVIHDKILDVATGLVYSETLESYEKCLKNKIKQLIMGGDDKDTGALFVFFLELILSKKISGDAIINFKLNYSGDIYTVTISKMQFDKNMELYSNIYSGCPIEAIMEVADKRMESAEQFRKEREEVTGDPRLILWDSPKN